MTTPPPATHPELPDNSPPSNPDTLYAEMILDAIVTAQNGQDLELCEAAANKLGGLNRQTLLEMVRIREGELKETK